MVPFYHEVSRLLSPLFELFSDPAILVGIALGPCVLEFLSNKSSPLIVSLPATVGLMLFNSKKLTEEVGLWLLLLGGEHGSGFPGKLIWTYRSKMAPSIHA